MALVNGFFLNPIVRPLKLAVCLPALVLGGQAWGLPVNGPDPLLIDVNTPIQRYEISSKGSLVANNAKTLEIKSITGGKLDLNATTVSAARGAAIDLVGSAATINGSTLIGQTSGLILGHQADLLIGSKVQMIGGSISGANAGASLSSLSTLSLQGTDVSGTGSNGLGINISGGGNVQAQGSSITGQASGIRFREGGQVSGVGNLHLDNTHVKGIEGAAILVGVGTLTAQATLHIGNGSTLTGGNGNMLEVGSGSTANVTVDNSHLTGDVRIAEGGTGNLTLQNRASLTGRLENVAQLTLNSQGQWNMVENGQVENLAMDGGAIQFGGATDFYRLTVANLSGNGTFKMDVDFGQAQNDFLDITGSATGNHTLLIASTGSDPLVDTNLHVVHAAAGDASFSLAGGAVDLGTWSYDLIEQDKNNWYLDTTTRTVSPGAASVIALFNTAPTVWYGELSTLRTRMGELRHNGAQPGLWMRAYANRFDVDAASGVGYQQNQQGLSLGADTALPVGDGQWLAGVMAGTSESNLDLGRGTSGEVNSYYTGAYLTWLDSASGYYFDGVLKLNRFDNESEVNLSDGNQTKGDYQVWGGGASLEFGRHLSLDQGWFVEPYAQIAALAVQGKDYNLDNGLKAEGDGARSLLAKAGATLGRNIALGQGSTVQPYVRAALAHEFVKTNEVQVNDNVFNNDLSGSRGELGAGVAMALNERFSLHVDLEYSHGERIAQPWGANVGLRYDW